MRNERRMSGSARGGGKPTAERQCGAHRLLNPFYASVEQRVLSPIRARLCERCAAVN